MIKCILLYLICNITVKCIILNGNIPSWRLFGKNCTVDSLAQELYRYNLNKSDQHTSIKPEVVDSTREDKNVIKNFCINQQNLILKQLLLPSLKNYKTSTNTSNNSTNSQNTPKAEDKWEFKVNDDSNRIRCSVLSDVPSGTVMVRPLNSKAEFTSLPVLNTLFRTRTNIIKLMYPKYNIKNLDQLYHYASLQTMLIREMCANDRLRRLFVGSTLLYGIKMSQEIILDLFFYMIRSKIFWNRTVYSYWSQSLSVPIPLLILTVNNVINMFLNTVGFVDSKLKDHLVTLEGLMLNRDLRKRFENVYIKDNSGLIKLHQNHLDS
ncbi:uncharacterized protein TA07760 [Theileria annulata]|uniref:Uncharacterized protein n=1 Tax=Theileria annulata TaxID=5874 RepID=Q4UA00_THEAN|nr:uncharacterized protein TA07760 [Theileria annulata]CAI76353.1 hypothetical protein, conserved [Theileria annulata]|eukprot:XP_952978.1 hypothetical protein, conserved [Theileria annulata]